MISAVMTKFYSIVILVIFCIQICNAAENRRILEKRILDAVLDPKRYDPRIRPDGLEGPESPLIVRVSLYIIDIHHKGPYFRDLGILCYLRQQWNDSRLIFKWMNYIVKTVHLSEIDKFWKPDIFIVNEISRDTQDSSQPNIYVSLAEDGSILYSARLFITVKCNPNLSYFPHDQQKCSINIESFGSYASNIVIEWDHHPYISGFNRAISKDKFTLLDFRTESYLSEKCNASDMEYSSLRADLLFSRNCNSYFWKLYLPCIVLVIISWISFCLSPIDLSPRIIVVALAFILVLFLCPDMDELRNELSGVTAIDVWLTTCIGYILAAFMNNIYAHKICKRTVSMPSQRLNEEIIMMQSIPISTEEMNSPKRNVKYRLMSKDFWQNCTSDSSDRGTMSRNIIFPLSFLIFNIIYWSVCYFGRYLSLEDWPQG